MVAAAMAYTKEHLQSVSLEEVCAAVAVSERTLRRSFRARSACPGAPICCIARMLRAMALLAAPAQTVRKTTTAVGFDSVGSFTRAFARFCGETPSTYRRRVNATTG